MQRLEVRGAVRPLYWLLGFKELIMFTVEVSLFPRGYVIKQAYCRDEFF